MFIAVGIALLQVGEDVKFVPRKILLVWLAIVSAQPAIAETMDASASWIRKTIRFQLTVRNVKAISSGLEHVQFYVPAVTSNQRLVSIQSSHPYVLEKDGYGNRMAVFAFNSVPPFGTVRISITSVVDVSAAPQADSSGSIDVFRREEQFIEAKHPDIQSRAHSLIDSTPENYIRNAYAWTRTNISYAGFIADDLGALHAVRARSGDCSEYAYLMAALGRARDVPVRVHGGYVLPSNGLARTTEYHNWNEVYLNGKWLLVDAQKGTLFSHHEQYITTRLIVRSGRNTTTDFVHRYDNPERGLVVEMD